MASELFYRADATEQNVDHFFCVSELHRCLAARNGSQMFRAPILYHIFKLGYGRARETLRRRTSAGHRPGQAGGSWQRPGSYQAFVVRTKLSTKSNGRNLQLAVAVMAGLGERRQQSPMRKMLKCLGDFPNVLCASCSLIFPLLINTASERFKGRVAVKRFCTYVFTRLVQVACTSFVPLACYFTDSRSMKNPF